MAHISPSRRWSPALVALLLSGCGERTYYAAGTVRFTDGTPVSGGQVEFRATERNISAIGFLDSNGAFELSTNGDRDGAYAGVYRVALQPPPFPILVPGQAQKGQNDIAAHKRWLAKVPARYHDPNTSGVEITIDGSTDDLEIIIEPTPGTSVGD